MASEADDETVNLRGERAAQVRRAAGAGRIGLIAGAAVLALGLAGGGWYALRAPSPPNPAPVAALAAPTVPALPAVPAPAPAVLPAPTPASLPVVAAAIMAPRPAAPFAPRLASEAEILADAPDAMAVYRFAAQPAIVVLQFTSLAEQGRALNRAAALLEKNGFPRNRVLPDAELQSRIRASGGDPDTFYYGHDYRATDLLRFFSLAAEAGVALTAEEQQVRELTAKLGWSDQTNGALISLVRQAGSNGLGEKGRATVLRHELSHGHYFTTPDYVAYAQRFWNQVLTARERTLFTTYLANDGYDPALADLMVNEMQAYLMHTMDQRFFSAAALGLPEARLASLRVAFLTGMPPSWLRDCTALPPSGATVLPVRAPRRRRRQRLGLVRTIRTAADRRTRLLAAVSRAERSSRT